MSISFNNEQINYLRIYIPNFGSKWPGKSKKRAFFSEVDFSSKILPFCRNSEILRNFYVICSANTGYRWKNTKFELKNKNISDSRDLYI